MLIYLQLTLQVQEWLYTDGEDASATEFEKKLDLLKAIGDPIFHRSCPSFNAKTSEISFYFRYSPF